MEQPKLVQRNFKQIPTTMMVESSGKIYELKGFKEEGIVYEENAGEYEEGEMSADAAIFEVAATNNPSGKITINCFGYSPIVQMINEIKRLPTGENSVAFVTKDELNGLQDSAIGCTLIGQFKSEQGKKKGHKVFVFQTPFVEIDAEI